MNTLKRRVVLRPLPKQPDMHQEMEPLELKLLKWTPLLLLLILIVIWWVAGQAIYDVDSGTAGIEQSIYPLIILGMICYLLIAGLCWWLMQCIWTMLGLPPVKHMVSQFKTLTLCQQLSFFLASLALQLFIAMGCLSAIC